jgi:endonuclease/exonuclease/phosphatase family metal-dependent hydrolase
MIQSEVTMRAQAPSRNQDFVDITLYSIVFLVFFHLISDFIEAIYAFGLLGTSLPTEMVTVLLLFSPLVLLLFRNGLSGWLLVAVGELMLLCRIVEPLLDTRGRMLVAGLGTACFLVFFPALFSRRDGDTGKPRGLILGIGLTLGLSLSILFRALGSGGDVSTYGWFQAVGWILAIIAGILMVRSLGPGKPLAPETPRTAGGASDETERRARLTLWRTAGLSLGVMGVLVLCYFAFTSPNVIARWTGASYPLSVLIIMLSLFVLALLLTLRPDFLSFMTKPVIIAWNILFVLALTLTILSHQLRFPTGASAYPLLEPAVTPWHSVPLVLMLILFPVILVDFILLTRELFDTMPSSRILGVSFTLGSLYFLTMSFAHIFTTVYDYIPVVGPVFRDKFWLVYLVAGLGATLPVLLVRRRSFDLASAAHRLKVGAVFPGLVLGIGLGAVAAILLTAANPGALAGQETSLRVLTYNIQQGYSEDGLKNYDGQLDLIRSVDADIIGLQESDTNRIAGGNSDVVRYFTDRLDQYSYYGPKTVIGTFGIALLSKYPIENPRTFYMYSEGEQTATIEAQITVGDRTFNVYVTHLGNDGPIVQQEAILQEVQGKENVVLVGDFNFRPDTEQYRLTTQVLDDSWLLRWPQGNDSQGIDPGERIDHIFVSPGTAVADSQYLASPQSDHPAMTTTVEW